MALGPFGKSTVVLDPKGSEYHDSTYIDPKEEIWEPLLGLGIHHIATWILWGLFGEAMRSDDRLPISRDERQPGALSDAQSA